MKKLLLSIMLSSSTVALSDSIELGKGFSKHLLSNPVNELHPFIIYNNSTMDTGFMIFKNSHDNTAYAIQKAMLREGRFEVKFGLVYGYTQREVRSTMIYNLLPIVVPSYTLESKHGYVLRFSQMGDAFVTSFSLKFGVKK